MPMLKPLMTKEVAEPLMPTLMWCSHGHEESYGVGGVVSGCQDVPLQNVEGREHHDGTQVRGEDHAGEAFKVQVNDDRGGDGTQGPQDEDHDHGLLD